MQDALLAARRALAVAKAHAQGLRSLEGESYPVAAILALLDRRLEALEPGREVSTEGWFAELTAPEAQVTLLLALLELARLQRVPARAESGVWGCLAQMACLTLPAGNGIGEQ